MSHSRMSACCCVFTRLVCEVWSGEKAALAKAPTCLSVSAADRDGCVSLFSRWPDWPHSAASALISRPDTMTDGHFTNGAFPPHMALSEQTGQREEPQQPDTPALEPWCWNSTRSRLRLSLCKQNSRHFVCSWIRELEWKHPEVTMLVNESWVNHHVRRKTDMRVPKPKGTPDTQKSLTHIKQLWCRLEKLWT